MAIAAAKAPPPPKGVTAPRIAPPVPAVSLIDEFEAEARNARIELMGWQHLSGRYLAARAGNFWSYREVCMVVARQNGKTKLLVPHVLQRLKMGRRVIHTAQNRTLPRQVYMEVTRNTDPDDVLTIRYANGQEHIELRNGGSYMIVAPQRGARGLSGDDLIIDEVREFEGFDIIEAATPTLAASQDPQILYLSNAGSDVSVVLNDLKRRGEGEEDGLAYLEWSAAPQRSIDDREGWAEANPSLDHFPNMLNFLEGRYNSLPRESFETEHLCRWVASMQPRLVSSAAWDLCRGVIEGDPINPSLGINMDPSGERASAVLAWQRTDGRIACVELTEAEGHPIDVDALGKDLRQLSAKHKVRGTSFASWTDADIARSLLNAKPLDGKEFANASENFVRLIQSGRLVWDGATHITDDLTWTARKPHESGAWIAVRASEEHSVTAVLAAIRAVWLASAPQLPAPRVF